MRRLLARASARDVARYVLAALLLGVAIILFGAETKRHLHTIEGWLADLGPWSLVVYVAVTVVVTSLLFPESVTGMMAGVLFGLPLGLAVALAATLIAAILQFIVARHLLRQRIERLLGARPTLMAIVGAVRREELRIQFLIRLSPLNAATVSYIMGATGIRMGPFVLALTALIPHELVAVYFGHAGKHAMRLAGSHRSFGSPEDLLIIGGLVATVTVTVFISHLARRAIESAVQRLPPNIV